MLSAPAASPQDGSAVIHYESQPALAAAVAGTGADIVRGQSPDPFYAPGIDGSTTFYPPTYVPDGGTTVTPGADPFAQAAPYPTPILSDPWLGGTAGLPYASPVVGPLGVYTFGLNGPRPYQMGWTDRVSMEFLPQQGTSNPNVGNLEVFGVDFEKEWVAPFNYNWIFAIAPQFSFRTFEGPRGIAPPVFNFPQLPGSAYRFGLNMKVATPQFNGWSGEFGFNPAFATDFEKSMNSEAYQWNAHAVAFWQWSPQWTWAIGAAYWDRVDDIILPYAGFVWTPDQFWKFTMVFPRPRIDYFIGTPFGVATWIYVGGEYHVESYQIAMQNLGGAVDLKSEVQLEDWRAFGGLRWEAGKYVAFVEAGAVLGRNVEYSRYGFMNFDVDDGFYGRMGFQW
jgi:hypothetical protein